MMKKIGILLACLLLLAAGTAAAEEVRREAPELTASCEISLNGKKTSKNVTDHSFKTF